MCNNHVFYLMNPTQETLRCVKLRVDKVYLPSKLQIYLQVTVQDSSTIDDSFTVGKMAKLYGIGRQVGYTGSWDAAVHFFEVENVGLCSISDWKLLSLQRCP